MSTATMDYNFLAHWHSAALTSVGLFWTAWWAFCLGYLISSMIQVFVTRTRMQQLMGKTGFRSVLLGTLFGFVSSSCSFAALSGTRALFTKGAGLVPSLAYLLSSTNLVIELGIIIAIFLSWQFVVGEYVGGILLILFMWLIVGVTQHYINVEGARQHAREQEVQGDGGGCDIHDHHHGDEGGHDKPHKDKEHDMEDQDGTHESNEDVEHGSNGGTNNENTVGDDEEKHYDQSESSITNHWKRSLLSRSKWQQVAMHYFMEWSMVWVCTHQSLRMYLIVVGMRNTLTNNSLHIHLAFYRHVILLLYNMYHTERCYGRLYCCGDHCCLCPQYLFPMVIYWRHEP